MKYKQLAEEMAKELADVKEQLSALQNGYIDHGSESLQTEEAKEILRVFAARANTRDELVLLVRALAKLPA